MHPRHSFRCTKGKHFGWMDDHRANGNHNHSVVDKRSSTGADSCMAFFKRKTRRACRRAGKREIEEELNQTELDWIDDAREMGFYSDDEEYEYNLFDDISPYDGKPGSFYTDDDIINDNAQFDEFWNGYHEIPEDILMINA